MSPSFDPGWEDESSKANKQTKEGSDVWEEESRGQMEFKKTAVRSTQSFHCRRAAELLSGLGPAVQTAQCAGQRLWQVTISGDSECTSQRGGLAPHRTSAVLERDRQPVVALKGGGELRAQASRS